MKSLLGAVGVERRGRVICGVVRGSTGNEPGRSCMDGLKSAGKSFEISKWEVWEAYRQVKANKGAPGVDKVTMEGFETDLGGNLYRIWNRMSSGSYFPPPVRAVEIPKPQSRGVRVLGVPTIAARGAMTVGAMYWGNGRSRGSTRTLMATGRASRPWKRSGYAGSGAGSTTGPSILMSRSSSMR